MPPPLILDPARLDFSHPIAGPAEIERINPHRHEFRLLDGVVLLDLEHAVYAGYPDIRPDALGVRGHIPGGQLFAGVGRIEPAGQPARFLFRNVLAEVGCRA